MRTTEYIEGVMTASGTKYETRTFLVDCFGWGREYFHEGAWIPVVVTDQSYLCGTVFRRPETADVLSFTEWKREAKAEHKAMDGRAFRYPEGAERELYEIYLKYQPSHGNPSTATKVAVTK